MMHRNSNKKQLLIFQNVMFCHGASSSDVLKHPAFSTIAARNHLTPTYY